MSQGNTTQVVVPPFTPPAFSQLNFTNSTNRCEIASTWLARAARAFRDHEITQDVPAGATIDYLKSILPEKLQADPAQIMAWYIDGLSNWTDPDTNRTTTALAELPNSRCGTAICNKLDWSGDPDVSGRGILVSYYSVAILALIYFIALTLAKATGFGSDRRGFAVQRAVSSFQESLNTFIDAALIFAVSMAAAGLTRFRAYDDHPEESQSLYGLLGSAYMASFSLLPALVLTTASERLRRNWLRLFLWMVLVGCSLALGIVFLQHRALVKWRTHAVDYPDVAVSWGLDDQRDESQAVETMWLKLCDPEELRFRLLNTLLAAHIIIPLNFLWLFHDLGASLVPTRLRMKVSPHGRNWTRWRNFRDVLRILNGVVCSVLMFVMLAFFHQYRNAVNRLAGASDGDTEWTFGQVIALAAWVPVLLEWATICLHGPEHGLSARLSQRYQVVRALAGDGNYPEKEKSLVLPTWEQHPSQLNESNSHTDEVPANTGPNTPSQSHPMARRGQHDS